MGLNYSALKPVRIRDLHCSAAHGDAGSGNEIDNYIACKADDLMDKYELERPPSPAFDQSLFSYFRPLARGCFGTVFQVRYRLYREFALKRVAKLFRASYRMLNEKKMLLSLNFPFTGKALATYSDLTHVYFVLEYTPFGTLAEQQFQVPMTEDVICFWVAQIVLALEYLHSADLIHIDVKPDNVLVYRNGYVKLVDFDTTKRITPVSVFPGLFGTAYYQAPEAVLHMKTTKAVDWFAVGVLTYELFYGIDAQIKESLDKKGKPRLYDAISEEPYYKLHYQDIGPGFGYNRFKSQFQRFSRPEVFISDAAIDFMYWLLRSDPRFRLGSQYPAGSSAVKKHRFFGKLNLMLLLEQKMLSPVRPVVLEEKTRSLKASEPEKYLEPAWQRF